MNRSNRTHRTAPLPPQTRPLMFWICSSRWGRIPERDGLICPLEGLRIMRRKLADRRSGEIRRLGRGRIACREQRIFHRTVRAARKNIQTHIFLQLILKKIVKELVAENMSSGKYAIRSHSPAVLTFPNTAVRILPNSGITPLLPQTAIPEGDQIYRKSVT